MDVVLAVEDNTLAHTSCREVCNEMKRTTMNIGLRKRPQTVNGPQHEVIWHARRTEERQQVKAIRATGGMQPQQEAI